MQGARVAAACALGRSHHITLGAASQQLRVADPRALAALLRTVTGEEYSVICARFSANSTMGVLDDLIPRIDRFVRCK